MEKLIGREVEIQILEETLTSPRSELVAMYGRRRVGKTYLIETVFEKEMVFSLTGIQDVNLERQLENFTETLITTFGLSADTPTPPNWLKAFRRLIDCLKVQVSDTKKVVFLDELPWFDTPKSGFLPAFDHFWNSWATKQKNLVVVICGSAASWMIQNIVRHKGGLHNRITRRIRLMPFNLYETEKFLRNQYVNLDRYQVVQLFMATGGIPQYLSTIKPGESATQIIDRLCFTKDGGLIDEFENLYRALFDNADKHICIVKALANKPMGLTRTEILEACDLSSGGGVTKLLEELLESGFITEYIPFDRTTKDAIFKLTDEYSLFYLKFIENNNSFGTGTWLLKASSPSWTSWSGLAFENIWLKHIPQIKKGLGIVAVYTHESAWRFVAKKGETGVQIDLLVDRQDNCINLCEIKFSNKAFVLTKEYADNLTQKRWIFEEKTGTKKTIFVTLLTTFGATMNEHYVNNVQSQLKMDVLFEPM
jgi:uncharacterized protein